MESNRQDEAILKLPTEKDVAPPTPLIEDLRRRGRRYRCGRFGAAEAAGVDRVREKIQDGRGYYRITEQAREHLYGMRLFSLPQ